MDRAQRILVVDDDELVLFTLHDILELMNDRETQVETAGSAQEALEALSDSHFDIVVTDIRLGAVSGVELTEQLVVEYPKMPVVWITAYGCAPVRADMERLGVKLCLEKPLDITQIRRAVVGVLQEWEQAHESSSDGG